jgi:hypothetical protein
MLKAIANGDFLINGFRNRDLHAAIYPAGPATDQERRSRSAHITYLLRILRGHGLIEKVTGTHRYLVTSKGREVIAAVIATDQAALQAQALRLES